MEIRRKNQRLLVKERFAQYTTPNILQELVSELLNKLKVKNNGSLTDKYLRAQAYANLHAYGYIDPDHPPCVPGYKMLLKLTDNTPVHIKHQKISQIESAFLQARTHEFLLTKESNTQLDPCITRQCALYTTQNASRRSPKDMAATP